MIKREVETELKRLVKQFKAVAVAGPRQSGKTTLTRSVFKKIPYVNLENPDSEGLHLMIRGDSCARDQAGHEIDVIIGTNHGFIPVEIKSGKTITSEFFKGLNCRGKLSGIQSGALVYGGKDDQNYSDGWKAFSWRKLHMLFKYSSVST